MEVSLDFGDLTISVDRVIVQLDRFKLFPQLIRELVKRFEHVIVDTPAHQYGADGAVIASRCGAALVVARKHSSRIGALQDLVAVLGGGNTKMAGVILNEFTG